MSIEQIAFSRNGSNFESIIFEMQNHAIKSQQLTHWTIQYIDQNTCDGDEPHLNF